MCLFLAIRITFDLYTPICPFHFGELFSFVFSPLSDFAYTPFSLQCSLHVLVDLNFRFLFCFILLFWFGLVFLGLLCFFWGGGVVGRHCFCVALELRDPSVSCLSSAGIKSMCHQHLSYILFWLLVPDLYFCWISAQNVLWRSAASEYAIDSLVQQISPERAPSMSTCAQSKFEPHAYQV